MPRIVKRLLGFSMVLMTLALTLACTPKRLQIAGQAAIEDGLIQQQIDISQGNNHWLWVCYTEVSEHQITGFSCQNDTAMPLFSGGIVNDASVSQDSVSEGLENGAFEFEYVSKLLLKIAPERMLEYIKISIYQPGTFTDTKQMKQYDIIRNSQQTDIFDRREKQMIRLTTL